MAKRSLIPVVLAAALLGCEAQDLAGDAAAGDVPGADVPAPVDASGDAPGPADVPADVPADASEDADAGCVPGTGCALESCASEPSGSSCLSGHCALHLGDLVCVPSCEDGCPPGFACGEDGACASAHPIECRPCTGSETCSSVGGVCADYGPEGAFCGSLCSVAEDCPEGYTCKLGTPVDGTPTSICMRKSGLCGCTPLSVAEGFQTACSLWNTFGSCSGVRLCTSDGLSKCSAATPVAETCNAVDDDCDGETDEGACDDGNGCTIDTCGGEAGCAHEPTTGGACDDADACTGGDLCDDGTCAGAPVACDDGDLCTDDLCDTAAGCVFPENAAPCDDGSVCTEDDACQAGSCQGTPIGCGCAADSDCSAFDDGDVCTGLVHCDLSVLPHKCAVVPGSVVSCPEPEGKNAPCLDATCDPESGACALVPVHEGFACDDGDACTFAEKCTAGACEGGKPLNCEDGSACTKDACKAGIGCTTELLSGACSDGNACTSGDACSGGACVPGTPVACDDGSDCTLDACDAAKGCVSVAKSGLCDDGNACTTGDQCKDGACKGQGSLACDDANPCTNDGCAPVSGCTHVPNVAACNDGDACTTGDHCDGGECAGGAALACDDGNPCTGDVCNAVAGCVHPTVPGPCDDADPCTLGDKCAAGNCVGAAAADCDDGEPCTSDSCKPLVGCLHAFNQSPCDDGDACTTKDTCKSGSCVGGTAFVCDDQNPCTVDSCGDAGCVFAPKQSTCDDGNACTLGDSCKQGKCTFTGFVPCDDGSLCTDDACDVDDGCVHEFNTDPCSTGNSCTTGDHCDGGACVFGSFVSCDDANPCTDDKCSVTKGCLHTNNLAPCDDKNACTDQDLCQGGSCIPEVVVSCDDGNPCTDDVCHVATGCAHTDNTAPCSTGNLCTTQDHCSGGDCVFGKFVVCDDGVECTADSCNTATGCVFAATTAGCDDQNACTEGDHCSSKSCLAGALVDCDDGDPCTVDSCDLAEGCVHEATAPCCGNGEVEAGEGCDGPGPSCTDACLVADGHPCDAGPDCESGACEEDLDGGGTFCAGAAGGCVRSEGGIPAATFANGAVVCEAAAAITCQSGSWSAPTACAGPSCTGSTAHEGQTCVDGAGCSPAVPAQTSCSPYACAAGTCKASCSTQDDCAPGFQCAGGACTVTINKAGSILAGSAYVGPSIPGYTQCAGFRNTTDWDIVTSDWVHSCAGNGSKKWLVRVYNPSNDAVLLEDTFPSFTQTELSNNLPGCNDSGYGVCGKLSTSGTGHALLAYKPNNGNGGCHGDDNSHGAFRIANSVNGDSAMGHNYVFVGDRLGPSSYRQHNNGNQPDSEIRFMNGNEWDGCQNDGRVLHAVAVYLED